MIRIHLSQDEAQRLEQEFRRAKDLTFRDRLPIIRLAHPGRKHRDIAAALGLAPRTIPRWLNAYLEHGLDGLRPRKAPGQPAKIPGGLADEVKRWVIEGPARQGLDRANWTHEELADHLLKVKGIRT